ncbi:hypothetical protein HYN48_04650 [Flavobacterium magnum]|uniref:Uncharacterized protein n=1 Tax=Flavobacterium magnum TaxID=2162713 RepID=A0A2S0RFD9_9FLAO|nr:hypothetical protein HYN48_04650 [Flavobacterium magnum]
MDFVGRVDLVLATRPHFVVVLDEVFQFFMDGRRQDSFGMSLIGLSKIRMRQTLDAPSFDVQKGSIFRLIYEKSKRYRSRFGQEGEQKRVT